eukprot:2694852-Heterocapsa_arctica.AAC.1
MGKWDLLDYSLQLYCLSRGGLKRHHAKKLIGGEIKSQMAALRQTHSGKLTDATADGAAHATTNAKATGRASSQPGKSGALPPVMKAAPLEPAADNMQQAPWNR